MNILEKIAEILLGIGITGIVSAVMWLFKGHNLIDLKLHDIGRDIAHLKRNQEQLSGVVTKLDIEDEKITSTFRKDLISIDRRVGRIEARIYVIEVLVKPPTTQV